MKSSRNKTIDFPLTEAEQYLNACVNVKNTDLIETDSIVIGDAYEALKKVADSSVDLLIFHFVFLLMSTYVVLIQWKDIRH